MLGDSDASRLLRQSFVQHIISKYICYRIFQPFIFSLGKRYDRADTFFQAMSTQLREKSTRKEAIWRHYTLLAGYTASNAKKHAQAAAASVIEEITAHVKPFADPEKLDVIISGITRIVKFAVETWRYARMEREIITASMRLDEGEPGSWEPHPWERVVPYANDTALYATVRSLAGEGPRRVILPLLPVFFREGTLPSLHRPTAALDNGKVYSFGIALYTDCLPMLHRRWELKQIVGPAPISDADVRATKYELELKARRQADDVARVARDREIEECREREAAEEHARVEAGRRALDDAERRTRDEMERAARAEVKQLRADRDDWARAEAEKQSRERLQRIERDQAEAERIALEMEAEERRIRESLAKQQEEEVLAVIAAQSRIHEEERMHAQAEAAEFAMRERRRLQAEARAAEAREAEARERERLQAETEAVELRAREQERLLAEAREAEARRAEAETVAAALEQERLLAEAREAEAREIEARKAEAAAREQDRMRAEAEAAELKAREQERLEAEAREAEARMLEYIDREQERLQAEAREIEARKAREAEAAAWEQEQERLRIKAKQAEIAAQEQEQRVKNIVAVESKRLAGGDSDCQEESQTARVDRVFEAMEEHPRPVINVDEEQPVSNGSIQLAPMVFEEEQHTRDNQPMEEAPREEHIENESQSVDERLTQEMKVETEPAKPPVTAGSATVRPAVHRELTIEQMVAAADARAAEKARLAEAEEKAKPEAPEKGSSASQQTGGTPEQAAADREAENAAAAAVQEQLSEVGGVAVDDDGHFEPSRQPSPFGGDFESEAEEQARGDMMNPGEN